MRFLEICACNRRGTSHPWICHCLTSSPCELSLSFLFERLTTKPHRRPIFGQAHCYRFPTLLNLSYQDRARAKDPIGIRARDTSIIHEVLALNSTSVLSAASASLSSTVKSLSAFRSLTKPARMTKAVAAQAS